MDAIRVVPIEKNSTHQEYSYSTGFEAIMGYLYLAGEKTRLNELLHICYQEGKEVAISGPTC